MHKLLNDSMTGYEAMKQSAYWDHDTDTGMFEGSLVSTFEDAGIDRSRYSQVVKKLKDMGCIEQVTRGNAHKPSKWILYKEPTQTDFEMAGGSWVSHTGSGGLRGDSKSQRITDLQARVQDLDYRLQYVERMLKEYTS